MKLAGELYERLLDTQVRNVSVKDVQCDEIWAYVQKKEIHKSPQEAHAEEIGDAYSFIGMLRHLKLILAWHLGKRTCVSTEEFIAIFRAATADYRFIWDGGERP